MTNQGVQRLRDALAWVDNFEPTPSDDAQVELVLDNTSYELLHTNESRQLSLGDLRDILAWVDGYRV